MSLVSTLNPVVRYLMAGMAVAIVLLGGALALSLGGNAWLFWKLAGAKAACTASQQTAVAKALQDEQTRAASADKTASQIAKDSQGERAAAVTSSQGSTNARETQIRTVVVRGDCLMPDGLPALQPAVDAANAAAR